MNKKHDNYIQIITNHIEKYIGKIEIIFHELKSDELHIDVHHIPPQTNRPWHTYITSGMGEIPMNVPAGSQIPKHAELMLYLPENKPISKENNFTWPIEMLKFFARYPFRNNTFFTIGHLAELGTNQQLFSQPTVFQGIFVYYPEPEKKNFAKLKINDDVTIFFYVILPLFREELDIDLKFGPHELINRLTANRITLICDDSRVNVGLNK